MSRDGIVPAPESPDNTLTGWAYRPDALGIALRHAWEATEGIPLLVTENGIATADDTRRIAYTSEALGHLYDAVAEGVDVRGYLPALVRARQLRVGPVGTDVRAHRRRP